MELKAIDIANLSVSRLNMRGVKKAPDLANILPSIRARGILVPLIVRAGDTPDAYEIVAGKRRYHAALVIAQETGGIDPLPCVVMTPGDDAAALEASLIENIARLDPDEMTQCETFTRLVREGRSLEHIALTFGQSALQVKRTLALGNLLPRIRSLFRTEKIDAVTVRHLTLASRSQQRDWLALLDDESAYVPTGSALKAWLFGGASICTKVALFDVGNYGGEIISDLFGEDSYFACAEQFWTAQMAAVEDRAEAYRDAGWSDVVILDRGEPFHTWEHERTAKKQGGKVYVTLGHRGDVTFHEGYVTCKDARRLARGEVLDKPQRPELTSALQSYIDLHRHTAVRAKLADAPATALRVMLAHAIVGSSLWRIDVVRQRGQGDAISESVETCASEASFDAKRRRLLALLGFDADTPTIAGGYDGEQGIAGLFTHLLSLSDSEVLDILAIVMGETLESGSALIELLGVQLNVDMATVWQADDALLDGIRDREIVGHVLADIAGSETAASNAKESAKVQRGIIRDCIAGTNGRQKVEGWMPKWMAFPPSAYTQRGGVGSVSRWEQVAELVAVTPDVGTPDAEPIRKAA
ncbi:chromosome partitioning protein ParB [Sphingobium sp. SCG-1]|uniref:ParB/RepB/Spo0J family partition protein n=1 Tax=Sphingobium sp. SCG-1 TaxID=2072936 RepID=UPI000CD6802C|nr:ParB/RepB/Spo0J family partition protein [Sphingobium sp. SCG-1]AUW56886.1 chromosome partitioning protein ParB [Sphingobium sp. SCG-1]AUW58190.1 chromosome partitioning protein ParB [Sphingobium sp. SCG-1]